MRKLMSIVFVLVFVVGLMVGMGPTPADAIGGCINICDCNGNPLTCCDTPWGFFCFPAIGWECTQGANC